jgi:cob(I)alamin adenosyltransferase
MGYRLTKIYTRQGDDGNTTLAPHTRVPKDSERIEALGTLDELNSAIGLMLSFQFIPDVCKKVFAQIQQDLFDLGGELCPPFHPAIMATRVHQLEQSIDEWNAHLPPLTEFILPGGNPSGAACHLARTVCRRAERCLVRLYRQEPFREELLHYINRLSDLLFVGARFLNKERNEPETLWDHTRQ